MNITVVRTASGHAPRAALENRQVFDACEVTCISLIGAAGSGKTSLLEAVVPLLQRELRVAVVVSDATGTADVARLARLRVPVVQVLTHGVPYLSAGLLQAAINELALADLDVLLVENVGGLLAPPAAPLGEHLRIALLSVAGGSGAIAKYPAAFRDAAVVLMTQCDLVPHVAFDVRGSEAVLRQLSPAAEIISTDARRRVGTDRLAGWILGYVRAQRPVVQRHEALQLAAVRE